MAGTGDGGQQRPQATPEHFTKSYKTSQNEIKLEKILNKKIVFFYLLSKTFDTHAYLKINAKYTLKTIVAVIYTKTNISFWRQKTSSVGLYLSSYCS